MRPLMALKYMAELCPNRAFWNTTFRATNDRKADIDNVQPLRPVQMGMRQWGKLPVTSFYVEIPTLAIGGLSLDPVFAW